MSDSFDEIVCFELVSVSPVPEAQFERTNHLLFFEYINYVNYAKANLDRSLILESEPPKHHQTAKNTSNDTRV